MSRVRLSDLPPAAREQATRQVSRQLGAGNGETVKPTLKPAAKETWFRIGAHGTQIFPVQVVREGKGWLETIQDGTGAVYCVRTDGEAEFYHKTRGDAVEAILARLHAAKIAVERDIAAVMDREWPREGNQ